MEICRLATCGHGLQRSSSYYSGIRCRIFRRGEAAHVKFGQGSAVADKSARRAASPSRQTCCKQIRWMLSVIKLHLPTSDSSAILAWSSKLMVDCDSMGLTAFRSQISEFFSPVGGHVTSKFAKCCYHQNTLPFELRIRISGKVKCLLYSALQIGLTVDATMT